MPTPNFTHDNTPPVAVTRADQTPNNGAPAGVPRASQAGDNTPPGNVTVSTPAHSDGAPVGIARPSQAPDNTAPGNVAVSTPAHADGAPVGIARADQTPNNAAPGNVAVSTPAHDNTAPTGIARPDETPNDGAPGAVPAGNTTGTHSTPQQIGYTPTLGPLTDETMHTPALIFVGNLILNQVFGYYKAPAACAITGVQLNVQKAPAGADVIIDLVDADGVSLARTATLPAGESFVNVNFAQPLPLLNAAVVRAKVTQIGAGATPGAYLTANLVVQLT